MRNRCLGFLCVLTILLAGFSVPPAWAQTAAQAATLRVFEDKAVFLAATGATSATGPLPNLGAVDGSATVGSVTFSLAPGGDSLFIGARGITAAEPDWYPPTPGNDIALGFENLRVQTAAPVFALGFEIVEPEATMPPWGGTPVNSTYTVTLFQGATLVGEFVFSNLPKDVVAFIGVWSDTAFDRVEIVDVTASPFVDDDEYFGQFYTGTRPAPPTTVAAVANTGTPVPGGSGVFTAFPQSPAVSAHITAFLGLGSAGEAGVYSGDRVIPGNPVQPIADRTTAIPGGAGMFTAFSDPSIAVAG